MTKVGFFSRLGVIGRSMFPAGGGIRRSFFPPRFSGAFRASQKFLVLFAQKIIGNCLIVLPLP